MEQNPAQAAILFSIFLVGLYIAGYFFPSALTWGFHFLGFLPWYVFVLYLIITFAVLYFIAKKDVNGFISSLSKFMAEKPTKFLLIVAAIVVGFAYLFQVRVPLLGDSSFLIKNYFEAARGIAPLYPRNEPLASYFFSSIMDAMGVATYKQFLDGFLLIDIILGGNHLWHILVSLVNSQALYAQRVKFCSVFGVGRYRKISYRVSEDKSNNILRFDRTAID